MLASYDRKRIHATDMEEAYDDLPAYMPYGTQPQLSASYGHGLVAAAEIGSENSLPPLHYLQLQGSEGIGNLEEGNTSAGGRRWPRQETLALLEVRMRLKNNFREAAGRAPLWELVSRVLEEEHGYQRSAKQCKEKVENLYKYYKKTKKGSNGGKNYRFFGQLDALYRSDVAETPYTSNPAGVPHRPLDDLIKFLDSSKSSTSSSTNSADDGDSEEECPEKSKSKGSRKARNENWELKMRCFLSLQLNRLMEMQDAWFHRMMRSFEQKEREKTLEEEAWNADEAKRLDREHKMQCLDNEWVQARETALMNALEKIISRKNTD